MNNSVILELFKYQQKLGKFLRCVNGKSQGRKAGRERRFGKTKKVWTVARKVTIDDLDGSLSAFLKS